MTGQSSRHPINETGKEAHARSRWLNGLRRRLLSPGSGNVFLCYMLILSVLLSPIALMFALVFAEPDEIRIFRHYFYIRTTVALLVIGGCISCLLIVLGTGLSSTLILAGLALLVLTCALTFSRCILGVSSALRDKAPRNYRSYLL